MAATLLLSLTLGAPLCAQEQLQRAVLLSGPTPVKGIPVYGPNRLPCFEGRYALGEESQSGAVELRVLYTQGDLYIPQTWIARRCGGRQVYEITGFDTFSICYRDERGFFVFFLFPEKSEPAYWCDFSDSFVDRFLFLLSFVDSRTDIPYPAILQMGE